MRVYISVDLEGVAAVATLEQVVRGQPGYPRAQRLMTAEANAAARGAFDAGAECVLVNDSHGTMDNLLHDELDRRIRVVVGSPKPGGMTAGMTAEHDVAFFVGYHAGAGAPGVLAHTFSPHFLEVRINGVAVSEADVNALLAAAVGVPVGVITGDDVICAAVRASQPQVHAVVVKTACGWSAAESLTPLEACHSIREAAARATAAAGDLSPTAIPDRLAVEIDMPNATGAERGALIPGVERIADRTLRAVFVRPNDLLAFITVSSQLAAVAVRARQAFLDR